MIVRTASCSCGRLQAQCSGEPDRISVCHCLACKRRTGSVFSYNATYPQERVRVSGSFSTFERASEDGFWGRHHFCPMCGVTIFYEIERRPEMISVPVGAFAEPGFPEPTVSVYGELGHNWCILQTAQPLAQQ